MLVITVYLMLASCAVPVQPTGGPPDKIPPKLLSTKPETGTIQFSERKVDFVFSEFINRPTFRSSLTIEPDLDIDFDVKWKKTKATVIFKDELPENTTIILSIGTTLADTRGNRITQPIQVALSTGDKIDAGSIRGKVLDAENGKGKDGQRIMLYPFPADYTQKATYTAQTDTSGSFEFNYLSEGNYVTIFLDDRNRNRIWDFGAENAQPFTKEVISVSDSIQVNAGTIYSVTPDTIAPSILGIGLFSEQRMRLRFSENIGFTNNLNVTISDSLSDFRTNAQLLYRDPKDAFVAYFQADSVLNSDGRFNLQTTGIIDAAGNEVKEYESFFDGSSQSDTTLQRIVGKEGGKGIFPDQAIEVVFAAPIADPSILDSTTVVVGETSNDDWQGLESNLNKLLIKPRTEWVQGINYQFLVWNPKTQRRLLIENEIWFDADLGEIEISTASDDSLELNYILQSNDGRLAESGNFTNQTTLSEIVPVTYKLIVYQDLNGNGYWDRGQVQPYIKPEPYFIRNPLRVSGGFTSEVNISFE